MHFWKIKRRNLARSATHTIPKGARFTLLFCGLLGIASVLLVSSAIRAIPNATTSNQDDRLGGQLNGKAPPSMAWIPGGIFLMGTNDKESFPNEQPAHLGQVRGFWMDVHDL
jgi:formylglycine-generating enzyme